MTLKNMESSEKRFKNKIIDLGQGTGELLHKWSDGTHHKTKEEESS